MGDFNARPLNQCHSNRKLRAASRRFSDFLTRNDLVASNVLFLFFSIFSFSGLKKKTSNANSLRPRLCSAKCGR